MTEDDNMVLRLLREIRQTQTEDHRRLIKVERRLDELFESTAMAQGMAAHAVAVSGQQGERFDQITDELEAVKRRPAELEAKV